MDSIILRNYQKKYISELQNNFRNKMKSIILCAPTGSGKTIMFSFMTLGSYDKNKKILILTDRKELFSQSDGTLQKFGLTPNLVNPKNKKTDGNLHVAMMQTVQRRLHLMKDFINDLDLIIIDEAHKTIFDTLFEYINPKTYVIGATATPHREGKQDSLKKYYSNIVQCIDTPELINIGNLSNCKTYGVKVDLKGVKTKGGDYDEKSMSERYSEIKLYHGVLENYLKICPNKKTLIFASSRESSEELVNDWIEQGMNARHVDCYMNEKERKDVLEWFDKTNGAILSNYGILTTGYDCPSIEVVILYRATKSLPLFLQMVGRGSRVTETKKEFILLDFGNNIKTHGFWEQERNWTLEKKEKKEGEAPIKECPECNYLLYASVMECPECGHLFQSNEKESEEHEKIELQLMSPNQMSFRQLTSFAKQKGFKDGWIWHQLKTLQQFKEYGKYKGYHGKWATRQWENRVKNSTGNIDVL